MTREVSRVVRPTIFDSSGEVGRKLLLSGLEYVNDFSDYTQSTATASLSIHFRPDLTPRTSPCHTPCISNSLPFSLPLSFSPPFTVPVLSLLSASLKPPPPFSGLRATMTTQVDGHQPGVLTSPDRLRKIDQLREKTIGK